MQEILPAQKLHQRARRNPSGPPRIRLGAPQKQIPLKGAGSCIAVDIAPTPQVRPAVPIEKVPVGLHKLVGMLLELFGKIGFVFIPVPEIP